MLNEIEETAPFTGDQKGKPANYSFVLRHPRDRSGRVQHVRGLRAKKSACGVITTGWRPARADRPPSCWQRQKFREASRGRTRPRYCPANGKTLIARLLIEFFHTGGRRVAGYDLDPREPALAGYFPKLIETVDIADTQDQMALFDRLLADKSADHRH